MSDKIERVLRSAGPLDVWLREAQRQGLDWEAEIINTFADILPKLSRRLEYTVWPGQLLDSFLEHFGLDVEPYDLCGSIGRGKVSSDGKVFRDCQIISDEIGILYRSLETEETIANNNWDWGDVSHPELALLYLRLAVREAIGEGHYSYNLNLLGVYIDEKEGLWVWEGAYIHLGLYGRRRDLKMPLEYLTNGKAAVAWLIENMDPKTIGDAR